MLPLKAFALIWMVRVTRLRTSVLGNTVVKRTIVAAVVILIVSGLWFIRFRRIEYRITFVNADQKWHEITEINDDGWQMNVENKIRALVGCKNKSSTEYTGRKTLEVFACALTDNPKVKASVSELEWDWVTVSQSNVNRSLEKYGSAGSYNGFVEMTKCMKSVEGKKRLTTSRAFLFSDDKLIWKATKGEDGVRSHGPP